MDEVGLHSTGSLLGPPTVGLVRLIASCGVYWWYVRLMLMVGKAYWWISCGLDLLVSW